MEKPETSAWKIPWKGIFITIFFSAVALVLVFAKIAKPGEILQELRLYPLGYFFGALFFVLAAWIVDGQRIGMLTRPLGHPMPWWQLALILGAANFLTLVTPFAGGGGALIVYFLYRRGFGVPSASAVVIAGGMAGQLSLGVLALTIFSTLKDVPPEFAQYFHGVKVGAAIYIVILLALLVVIVKSERFFQWAFRKRGAESRSAAWLDEFRSVFQTLVAKRWGYFLGCIATALCYYVVYYLGSFVLLSGFRVFHPWLRYAIAVLFGVAPVFSPIPGGAGVSEGIAWFVLDDVLAPDALGTFIVLWRTVVFYIPILLGGSIFAISALRWASPVILPEEEDHTR